MQVVTAIACILFGRLSGAARIHKFLPVSNPNSNCLPVQLHGLCMRKGSQIQEHLCEREELSDKLSSYWGWQVSLVSFRNYLANSCSTNQQEAQRPQYKFILRLASNYHIFPMQLWYQKRSLRSHCFQSRTTELSTKSLPILISFLLIVIYFWQPCQVEYGVCD